MLLKRIYCLIALTTAACQPTISEPVPTPVIWYVQTLPSLRWLGPEMNTCVQKQSGTGILIHEEPMSSPFPEEADFVLSWGEADSIAGDAVILGWDQIIFIVHPQNPIKSLSQADLYAIFNGEIRSWSNIIPNDDPEIDRIKAWDFPTDHAVRHILEVTNMIPPEPGLYTSLAPEPNAMREAVSGNSSAIGYLPSRWLNPSVKQIDISDFPKESFRQPIIAQYSHTPKSGQIDWLLCLQKAISP